MRSAPFPATHRKCWTYNLSLDKLPKLCILAIILGRRTQGRCCVSADRHSRPASDYPSSFQSLPHSLRTSSLRNLAQLFQIQSPPHSLQNNGGAKGSWDRSSFFSSVMSHHQSQVSCFLLLTTSFVAIFVARPLFSATYSLFCKIPRGWGYLLAIPFPPEEPHPQTSAFATITALVGPHARY